MSKNKSFFPSFLYFFGPVFFIMSLLGVHAGFENLLGYLKFSTLPEMSAKTVSQLPGGKSVLVAGRIANNQVGNSGKIVLWECSDGFSDLMNPINLIPVQWRSDGTMYPSMRVELEDGTINTEAVPRLALAGLTLKASTCEGLMDKSWVTLVGRKIATGQIQPEYIFVGQRQQAVSYYRGQVNVFPTMSIVTLISLFISLGFFIPWYIHHIKSAAVKVEPEVMYLPKPRMKRRARHMRMRIDDEG